MKDYLGEWVALTADKKRVAGHSKNLKRAIEQANRNGVSVPHVIKSPAESFTVFIY